MERGLRCVLLILLAGCASVPPESTVETLEGVWESNGGFEYTRMDITADGGIVWLSGGCCDDFHDTSRGMFREGKLVLSKPVLEYAGPEVSVFHYFRDKGREYLVAEEHMDYMRENAEPFDRDVWWGLRRRIPKSVLERRFATCADGEARAQLLDEWADWPVDMAGVGYLARIVREDPSEAVRATALCALKRAGMDDYDKVADQVVRDAADAIVRQLEPGEESGCTPDPAPSGTQGSCE